MPDEIALPYSTSGEMHERRWHRVSPVAARGVVDYVMVTDTSSRGYVSTAAC